MKDDPWGLVLVCMLLAAVLFLGGFLLGRLSGIDHAIKDAEIYLSWVDEDGREVLGTPTDAEFLLILDGEVYVYD